MVEGARMRFGPLLFGGTAPLLGFGAWAVGGAGWGDAGEERERLAAIHTAVERGVRFFDTAPTYGAGASERLLGEALKPVRDQVVIATKVGPHDDPRRSLDESLRRLDTDCVDLVQLHEAQDRWEWQIEKLHGLVEHGKARAIGLCNATALQIARAMDIVPLASYQGPYNLLDRDVEQRELPLLRERGIAFLAYRPLAAGLLSGRYAEPPAFGSPPRDHRAGIYWFKGREFARRRAVIDRLRPLAGRLGLTLPAFALRWLLGRPGVSVVLAGARTAAQVEENLTAPGDPLPAGVVAAVDEIVAAAFRLPRALPRAARESETWGARERFIVSRLDGSRTAEAIAAEWTDRGERPMVAAQVKLFADQLEEGGLAQAP